MLLVGVPFDLSDQKEYLDIAAQVMARINGNYKLQLLFLHYNSG